MAITGVVDGRYSIEREVGRGGMATVYLARDLRHGNRVALKILTADFASVVGSERFAREIRITAGLQHPNILPVFDSGEVDGLPYYVMPFVDGPTLEYRIRTEGPLPIDDALEIACEVADALDHAHAEGFVHRDIKPSNILLAHGHAVVADFGIARTVEAAGDQGLTRTGIAVGTAAYMSPEQASGEKVDGRSDIYSLGCVLYEMLAGHPPFRASTPRGVMAKHWMDEVPSLRDIRSSVRSSIESVIRKALAKSAAERFNTAGEFEQAMQRLSTEEKIAAVGIEEDRFRATPSSAPQDAVAAGTGPFKLNRRTAAIGALAVAVAGFAAWTMTRPARALLDANKVMVFPLIVSNDFRGSRSVGEDIGTMIGAALDGAGRLRWIDGWPLLSPSIKEDPRTLTNTRARDIARSKRAAYYLTGRIVARGDSAAVYLDLLDAYGDSAVARGSAVGPTADAWRTGLHAVNEILPALIPTGAGDVDILAEWNDRKTSAIASFLLGEAAFRRVQMPVALRHFRDAVRADSTFGLAAIRGAQAATWNHRSGEAESFIDAALRQPLSPRYTHFARGYQAYIKGAADSAAAEFRRVIKLDPEMAVAWMQLGEVYTHLLPAAGNPDSLARIAFDEAHHLDPSATNPLFHSIEIRLRSGEVADAGAMVTDFLAGAPDSVVGRQVRAMYDCARNGSKSVPWQRLAREDPVAVLGAANALKGGGANLDCVADAYRGVIDGDTAETGAGRRWIALVGLGNTLVARNRPAQFRALIDSTIAAGGSGASVYLMAGAVFPELREATRAIAQRDEATFGANYASCPYIVRLWQLGVWEALAGRPAVAAEVAGELSRRATKSGAAVDLTFARSMNAFSALAQHDTATALATLDSIVSEPAPAGDIVWDMAAPRGIERLTLARLLAARGDYRKALDVANVFDAAWPSIYLLYVPASLEVRADAASRVSDKATASHFRSRLAALRGERLVAGK